MGREFMFHEKQTISGIAKQLLTPICLQGRAFSAEPPVTTLERCSTKLTIVVTYNTLCTTFVADLLAQKSVNL
jgi:hypothetical protein